MRGSDASSGNLFSYIDLEERVPQDHPLRVIRRIADEVLAGMSGAFDAAYAPLGRPSIPPEKLLRALLLQAFYSIRSERQLMDRLDFDLLFRWFVGLGIDDRVWDASSFSKNRDRFLAIDAAAAFLSGVAGHGDVRRQMSRDHFSVDGTLIDAWASMKSFTPKEDEDAGNGPEGSPGGLPAGRNGERDFRNEKRSNETHASTTDPDARLYRKGNGRESRLCFMGHAVMENRNGLVAAGCLTLATGTAEREAALEMLDAVPTSRRRTLAGDKGYDVTAFVDDLRARRVTPHIAVQGHLSKTGKRRKTRIDGRTTRHTGYGVSQRIRKRIEEVFGWAKTVAGWRKSRFRGRARAEAGFLLALAAYNLIRMPKLLKADAAA